MFVHLGVSLVIRLFLFAVSLESSLKFQGILGYIIKRLATHQPVLILGDLGSSFMSFSLLPFFSLRSFGANGFF